MPREMIPGEKVEKIEDDTVDWCLRSRNVQIVSPAASAQLQGSLRCHLREWRICHLHTSGTPKTRRLDNASTLTHFDWSEMGKGDYVIRDSSNSVKILNENAGLLFL